MNLNKHKLKMTELKKSNKLILFAFLIFFAFFGQCKEKVNGNITTTDFKFEGRFITNDETIFKLNQTTIKLFSDQPDHVEILTDSKANKIDITEANHCNMDAVGVSAYLYSNSNNSNLKIILIEDYQDILTGSLYAVLVDKDKLVKTFRFCGPQYHYEKYSIKDILSIKKTNNQISFTFDPKKIVSKNKEHIFNFSLNTNPSNTSAIKNDVPSQKGAPIAVTSNEVVLDSLVFDFNNDQIKDKVLIRANLKEKEAMGDDYFNNIDSYYRTLDILVGKNNGKYTQISSNKNIIPCLRCNEPMEAYSDFKRIGKNSFSIDVIQKAESSIYQLVFEWKKDNFYLTEIGVKTFYDENAKMIKLKHSINIKEVMTKNISDYIKQ